MTACRSSRFLPDTRNCSPCVWLWMPLADAVLYELVDGPGLVRGDPRHQRDALAGTAPRGLFELPPVERLERHLAAYELLLEHLPQGGQTILRRAVQREHVIVEVEGAVGPLEVEAVAHLAASLVDGVADLLHVERGDHVEAGHVSDATAAPRARPRRLRCRPLGRCPSGQRERAVNPPAYAYGGSNPSRPTTGPLVTLSRGGGGRCAAGHASSVVPPPPLGRRVPAGHPTIRARRRPPKAAG